MPEIRPARPGDESLIAEVLEMAGRGHLPRGPWDLMFPDPGERRRALSLLAGGARSWCHHSVFHVAELAGAPGAALCGFETRALGGADLAGPLAAIFERLGWTAEHRAAVGPAIAPYLSCFPAFGEGIWIVENVGTRPEFRRRGLVGALLAHVLEEGRRRGHREAQISCLIGNDAARFAYERAGFRAVEERKDAAFEALYGAPGFVRMTRSL